MKPHSENFPYVPGLGIVYPADPDAHMIPQPQEVDINIDENYPFLDKSFSFRFWSALMHLGIFTLVFVLSFLRFGLKIEGKDKLKKNRHLFRRGALTVSNHVQRWDFLFVLLAVKFRRLYFPAWKGNISGPDRRLIRLAGGIPVPTDLHVIRFFNAAFDELYKKRKWFHVFPESSNWPYYQYIRPFKKGMFSMAHKYNIPVIPMALSYRPPRGLYKLFKKNYPLLTLRIGDPILPDMSLPRKETVNLLRARCHKSMVELAGIRDNPWPCEGD
jgi:1-acyl-sn-glycerol-3-phosphate acyltransferase